MSKAERTRRLIVEKTAPIFNTKGYAGTSMSDLTQATGLTKGAIYGNFENKDEVALEAFRFNMKQITSAITELMDSRKGSWEKLMAFPEYYDTVFTQHGLATGCPIVNTAPEVDDTHPVLSQAVNEAIRQWDTAIQRLVAQGIETGQIRRSTNASEAASLMITLIEGGVLLSKSTGNMKYLRAALDQVVTLLQSIRA
jgi:AcrR family transcriptional regulator